MLGLRSPVGMLTLTLGHAPERALATSTEVSLVGFPSLADRRGEQVLAGAQIVLAAHHRAGRSGDFALRSQALSILHHVVVACLLAQAAS